MAHAVEGISVAALAQRSGLNAELDCPDAGAEAGLAADIDSGLPRGAAPDARRAWARPWNAAGAGSMMRRTVRPACAPTVCRFHLMTRTPAAGPDPAARHRRRIAVAYARSPRSRCGWLGGNASACAPLPGDGARGPSRRRHRDPAAGRRRRRLGRGAGSRGSWICMASSDYGQVFGEMLGGQADALDSRTAVLIVGDGRSGDCHRGSIGCRRCAAGCNGWPGSPQNRSATGGRPPAPCRTTRRYAITWWWQPMPRP